MAIPAPSVNVGRRRRRARSPQRRGRSRSRSISPRERRAREDSEEARRSIREMREIEARDAEERRRRILHASLRARTAGSVPAQRIQLLEQRLGRRLTPAEHRFVLDAQQRDFDTTMHLGYVIGSWLNDYEDTSSDSE